MARLLIREGIVEKVGIDLGLQEPKFIFLLADLGDQDFVDQMVQLGHHAPEGPDQKTDLVFSVIIGDNVLVITGLYPGHAGDKFFQGADDQTGKELGGQGRQK